MYFTLTSLTLASLAPLAVLSLSRATRGRFFPPGARTHGAREFPRLRAHFPRLLAKVVPRPLATVRLWQASAHQIRRGELATMQSGTAVSQERARPAPRHAKQPASSVRVAGAIMQDWTRGVPGTVTT